MVKRALIVEGGAMRTIYAAGVLDAFAHAGHDPFDLYIGVSAGALNLSSFLAGQHGRNHRVILDICTRPEFIRYRRLLAGGNVMDLNWLWWTMLRREPLDVIAAHRNTRRRPLLVGCTRVEDGQPTYVRLHAGNWLQGCRATSALPLMYREPVFLHGQQLVDGAVSDPIPVREASRRGARDIVVIRSHPAEFRKKSALEGRIVSAAMRAYPGMREALMRHAERYNETCAFMEQAQPGLDITQIAPVRPLFSRRTTRNRDILHADYSLGYENGLAYLRTREQAVVAAELSLQDVPFRLAAV